MYSSITRTSYVTRVHTCNVNCKIMQGVHFYISGTAYGQALVCETPAVLRLPNDPCAVRDVPNNVLKKMLTPKRKELTLIVLMWRIG